MAGEHNWAENHRFTAARIHRPNAVDDVRRIVARSPHVHAIGARHSFSGIADTAGDLIDLANIDPGFAIDPDQRTVTAGAGTTYGAAAAFLQREGWALHNTASLPHVTLAGATATGTHGSGDRNGTLSSAVAGLEIVTATGDLIAVRRGDPAFDGMVVGLGTLGVVTRMTLDIQPSFEVRQDAFEGLKWSTVFDDLDAVMSAGYSVSLMTTWSGPTVTRLWVKTRLTDGAPSVVSMAHLGVSPAPYPSSSPPPETGTGLTPFGVPGPWSERLPHFYPDASPGSPVHLQSEYMVPRAKAVEAMRMLRTNADRIDPLLLTTEVRSMAADALWLSPSYGHDSIALHFSWRHDIAAVAAVTAEVEAMLLPLGARPHWGKILHARADHLAPLYPRMMEFRELAKSFDPAGKFRNAFLATHVFG